jgi:biopolymer transport protein ExbB/TolQ
MIEFTLGVVSTVLLAAFIWSLVKIIKQTSKIKEIEEQLRYSKEDLYRLVDSISHQRDDDRRNIQDQLNYFERVFAEQYVKKVESKKTLNG